MITGSWATPMRSASQTAPAWMRCVCVSGAVAGPAAWIAGSPRSYSSVPHPEPYSRGVPDAIALRQHLHRIGLPANFDDLAKHDVIDANHRRRTTSRWRCARQRQV